MVGISEVDKDDVQIRVVVQLRPPDRDGLGSAGMATDRYTSGAYAAATKTWHDEDGPYKAKWVGQFLKDNGIKPGSICDFGCGTGGLLDGLHNFFPDSRLYGYEISADAIQIARRNHPEIDVQQRDPRGGSEHFDVVVMADVFEHVDDYLGLLGSVRTLGDYLVCHIPLDISVQTVLRERPFSQVREQLGHLHYFNTTTALSTLDEAGYQLVGYKYTAGTVELPNHSRRRRTANVPRKLVGRMSERWSARLFGGYSLLTLSRPK